MCMAVLFPLFTILKLWGWKLKLENMESCAQKFAQLYHRLKETNFSKSDWKYSQRTFGYKKTIASITYRKLLTLKLSKISFQIMVFPCVKTPQVYCKCRCVCQDCVHCLWNLLVSFDLTFTVRLACCWWSGHCIHIRWFPPSQKRFWYKMPTVITKKKHLIYLGFKPHSDSLPLMW